MSYFIKSGLWIKKKLPLKGELDLSWLVKSFFNTEAGSMSSYYMNDNTTPTVILQATTPVKIGGATTSSSFTTNFVNSDNKTVYTGSIPQVFRASLVASVKSEDSHQNHNHEVHIGFFKNGQPLLESASQFTVSGGIIVRNVVSQVLVEMSSGDYLEGYVSNLEDTGNIIVVDLNVILK